MMEKFCVVYRQPLYIKTPDEKGAMQEVPNISLIESFRWLEENIKSDFISEFTRLVLESFEPTTSAPFPLPAHFKKIYDQWNVYRVPDGIPNRIRPDKQLTENSAVQGFIETAPFDLPEGPVDVSLDKLVFDGNTMPEKMLLQKYGVEMCGRLWTAQGEYAVEHGLEGEKLQAHVFKAEDLEKYFNKKGNINVL